MIFRMQNLIIRGEGNECYVEAYGGSRDMSEDIATSALTGTLTLANSFVVTGTGTLFTIELHLGQFVLVGTAPNHSLMVVASITDDTHFTATRKPVATGSGLTGTRLPVIWEMDNRRATALRGNAIQFDQGTILGVGDGTLRLNGAALSASFALTRQPKIALYNAGTYTIFPLGMATPTSLSAAAVAGTGKNMQAGVYSARVVPARQATLGYNNPSPKAEVTLAVGQAIQLTVPAADTTNGQDAWMIFASLYTQVGGTNGPWYRYELPTTFVEVGAGGGQIPAAGGTYTIEYNDAEISGNNLLTFNNDAPPNAEYIGTVAGIPAWISCQGPGSTSPGPFLAPAKSENIEAAPAGLYVSTSLPDTIVGFSPGAQGRLYLLCTNSLQIAIATQAQDPRIPPLVARPFWHSGFIHIYQALFLGGTLIGCTTNGLARSAGDGDESSIEYNFATAVNELVLPFNVGHMLLGLDPQNTCVCLFMSAYNQNANGFWTTRVLMYSFKESKWVGDVLLTSTTGDMIISGVATVSDELYFLAGGRQSNGSTTVRTYKWDDASSGQSVPWYLATQFTDDGVENRPKRIQRLRITGKFSGSPTAGIWIAQPGDVIPVLTMEIGPNSSSTSGSITLPTDSNVAQENITQLSVKNASQYAVRVDGTYSGAPVRDRLDEIIVESMVEGARR